MEEYVRNSTKTALKNFSHTYLQHNFIPFNKEQKSIRGYPIDLIQ